MILELINSNNKFRPFFKSGETNHLPMALYAMEKLNATEKEMKHFIVEYEKTHDMEKLHVAKSVIYENNWIEYLGNNDMFEDYQVFFNSEIKRLGWEKTIITYFNRIISGIASEAFHCLIKLCYAIESKNSEEVVNGLAYSCACYFEIPTIEKDKSKKSVAEIIKDIENSNWFSKHTYEGNTISKKLIKVFHDPEFSTHIQFPDFTNEVVIQQLKNSVLKIHLAKWNFISLHMVTSFHSLKIIEPFILNKEDLYIKYWTSIIGCLLAINKVANTNSALDIVCDFSWEVTFKKAIETMDEHAIKLVYSCFMEYNLSHDFLFEAIASKATNQMCI